MCGLILVEASFSMNIYKCDNWYSPRGEDVLESPYSWHYVANC